MSSKRPILLIAILAIIVVLINSLYFIFLFNKGVQGASIEINPSDFTSEVTNKYFALVLGKKMVYEGETEDGLERVEVYVTNEKKIIMGIETIVVWDRVWLNNELIEDTKDWFAQDKEGNVWYFGEDSKEIINGQVVNTKGSWEAGVDGAKPGIVMKTLYKIKANEEYRQEYYKGKAEDKARVISLNEQANTKFGGFEDCIQTLDYTPLEPGVEEHKYYCSEVGGVVLEINLEDNERIELVSLEYNAEPSPSQALSQITTEITKAEAEQIALARVPGTVTDTSIERKFGKLAYVVEIETHNGETDVIIDMNTGEILGIET